MIQYALVIVAVACFAAGVVLIPLRVKLLGGNLPPRPHLLPSTAFTCTAACAGLALITLRFSGSAGSGVLFLIDAAGLSGGFLGAVATLFSMRIVPRWQSLAQFLTSAIVFASVLAKVVLAP